eukprot:UN3569
MRPICNNRSIRDCPGSYAASPPPILRAALAETNQKSDVLLQGVVLPGLFGNLCHSCGNVDRALVQEQRLLAAELRNGLHSNSADNARSRVHQCLERSMDTREVAEDNDRLLEQLRVVLRVGMVDQCLHGELLCASVTQRGHNFE